MPIRSIYLLLLNFHLKKRGGKKTENEERNTRLFRAEDEPANFPPILISRIWKLLHCFSKSVKLQERWSTEVPGPILQRIQEDSDPMSLVTETSAKLPARNSRIETFTVIQHRTDNCSLSIYSRCVSFVELAPTLRRSNSSRVRATRNGTACNLVLLLFSICRVGISMFRGYFLSDLYIVFRNFFHHDSSWLIFDIDGSGRCIL